MATQTARWCRVCGRAIKPAKNGRLVRHMNSDFPIPGSIHGVCSGSGSEGRPADKPLNLQRGNTNAE